MSSADVAGVLCAAFVFLNTVSIILAAGRIAREDCLGSRPTGTPPVTLVRPVCGLEPFSDECLRSGFEIDYPAYELLFCVARANDPVIPLVERLIASHPGISARLLIGEQPLSENPKLNNCAQGWASARHEWIVLADSNVLMPRDYIRRLLAAWRHDSGVVCSTPIGSRPQGFWAEIECAALNTLQARWQYAVESLGLGFAQGKSMLWRRSFLDAHGGIRALGAEIAEDAAATKLVRRAGLRVHLVDRPFEQPLGRRTAAELWSRQLRWGRLRRVTFPMFFVPEIFSGPILPIAATFAAALLSGSDGTDALTRAGSVLAATYAAEAALASYLGWHLSWRSPFAWLARDLLQIAIWGSAWVTNDVVWRGNPMTIRTRTAALAANERAA